MSYFPFPPVLRDLHALSLTGAWDVRSIDFNSNERFERDRDLDDWFRGWTGNPKVSAHSYRAFGADESGGLVCLWIAHRTAPVVFFGSEGELGVVSKDLGDFLAVLAAGVGPRELVTSNEENPRRPIPEVLALVEKYFPDARDRNPEIVLREARAAFPTFVDDIRATCR